MKKSKDMTARKEARAIFEQRRAKEQERRAKIAPTHGEISGMRKPRKKPVVLDVADRWTRQARQRATTREYFSVVAQGRHWGHQ